MYPSGLPNDLASSTTILDLDFCAMLKSTPKVSVRVPLEPEV